METTEREENGMIIREHKINGVLVGKEEFPVPSDIPPVIGPTMEDRLKITEDTQAQVVYALVMGGLM